MTGSTLHADACVVGAGAGGAVVAAELAEGGANVVMLEQGPEHDPDGFTARPPQMLARLYRDGGQTMTVGLPPIGLPLGRGLGGTTLVNSGTCFRTPARVLERWRQSFGLELDETSLGPCFERVERALSVSEVTPELAGQNAAVARRGAERLGLVARVPQAQCQGLRRIGRLRVRLPDLRQAAHGHHVRPESTCRGRDRGDRSGRPPRARSGRPGHRCARRHRRRSRARGPRPDRGARRAARSTRRPCSRAAGPRGPPASSAATSRCTRRPRR